MKAKQDRNDRHVSLPSAVDDVAKVHSELGNRIFWDKERGREQQEAKNQDPSQDPPTQKFAYDDVNQRAGGILSQR